MIQMKKSAQIFILVVLTALVFGCGNNKSGNSLIFDATQIKGHPDTTEVKKLLHAQPDTSYYRWYFGQRRFIQLYNSMDSAEFRFKKNKLIEIIVNSPPVDYIPQSITKFGLPFQQPTSSDSSAYFMWKNIYPEYEVVNYYLVGSKKKGPKQNFKIYFKLKD
ncbi:hypothetical protein PbJCM13498_16500 [Prolixibacter bellariivorans]|uniref:Lipoprotein n=2 Tax=Prolixibacter bellariivorans TaxID=314319 RepID=A0A5M4AZE7_9BACT|nr:hypothetical protein PbJCM13498_16500 [Prolixibacter bellariivorans]